MRKFRPIHYTIHLTPDLKNFIFDGEITIDLELDSTSNIELHARELEIHECKFEGKNVNFDLSMENQTMTITLPEEKSGQYSLYIRYTGEINDKLAGFYRSPYEIDGKTEYCAITQFQENDARRAFPCVDEPGTKATFDISYTIDKELMGISNTSIVEEKELNGKKFLRFERTPKMSTYLVFFGVGKFEWIEGKFRDIPVRLLASPGKPEKYGKLGLEYGIKSLEFCEEYFKIPYPLSKMDLIATPAFAAGAMENWGAVTFRENVLLYYPGVTSKNNEMRIKEVIAHEITHQWFGNLTSPVSWKYVWLNESFATFFAYGIVDHFEPEFRVWDFFIQTETSVALHADGYLETAPIEIKGEQAVSYTLKTVPIFYNKGACVLRQIKAYLGNDDFQKGLNHYLTTLSYDVATSDQLWDSLEKVSGKPVSRMMETWILQEGYPVIHVRRDGNDLHLSQHRFTYLSNDSTSQWLVPILLRLYHDDGTTSDEVLLMESETMVFTLPENVYCVKVNVDHTGFYRVHYENELEKLGRMIAEKKLSPIDRWAIENDLFAFLVSGMVSLEDYLSFLDYYSTENDHLSLRNISGHLNTMYSIFEGEKRARIKEVGRSFLSSVLDQIGIQPREGEHHTISMLRGTLLSIASKFEVQAAIDFIMEQFESLKQGNSVDAEIYPAVVMVAARLTNDWDWFKNRFENATNEVENIYYSMAMANFTQKELIERYQEFIFEGIPQRNRSGAISTLANNEFAKDTIWEWYMANLDNFEKLHPFIYQRAINAVITASDKYEKEVRDFFAEYVKKNPDTIDAVDKALETLSINIQLKSR